MTRAPRSRKEPSGAGRGAVSAISIVSDFGTRESWTFAFSWSVFSFSVSGAPFFASSCFAFSSALRRSSRAKSTAEASGRR